MSRLVFPPWSLYIVYDAVLNISRMTFLKMPLQNVSQTLLVKTDWQLYQKYHIINKEVAVQKYSDIAPLLYFEVSFSK